jgi:lysophospholipase L1-like esterase
MKRIAQNLALSAGTFLFCFLLLEGILRLSGFGNLEIYEPHPVLYWWLKANQDCYTKVDRKPVHVNSHHTRGPEFEIPKPPKTFRILSLGDSKTFGWGVTEAESYSGLIEKQLSDFAGAKRKIEVVNAGVNAWSYAQMNAYLREYGLACQPDLLILADANLWTQFSEQSSPEFVKKFMWRVRLKNFLRRFATYHYIVEYQLQSVYERTRAKFIPMDPKQDTFFKEQQQKDPDAFYRNQIASVCKLALTNRISPVLLYIPSVEQLAASEPSNVLRAKRQISRELNIPLIDMTEDLKPKGKELFLEGDSAHLNAAGNVLVARRLFLTLTNLIKL